MNGENFEEVGCFIHTGINMVANGTMEAAVNHGVGEGSMVLGTLWNVYVVLEFSLTPSGVKVFRLEDVTWR